MFIPSLSAKNANLCSFVVFCHIQHFEQVNFYRMRKQWIHCKKRGDAESLPALFFNIFK